ENDSTASNRFGLGDGAQTEGGEASPAAARYLSGPLELQLRSNDLGPRETTVMPNRPPGPSGLEVAAGVWSRRKWLAAVVFAATFTAAASIVRFLPDVYRSTATVLVERHEVSEAFVKSSVTGEVETRLQTISQEILSRGRL